MPSPNIIDAANSIFKQVEMNRHRIFYTVKIAFELITIFKKCNGTIFLRLLYKFSIWTGHIVFMIFAFMSINIKITKPCNRNIVCWMLLYIRIKQIFAVRIWALRFVSLSSYNVQGHHIHCRLMKQG
jgi:hypothetical protein